MGTTKVEGAVVFGTPRLLRVDGIHCEAPLNGHLIYLKNADVPGVIGYVGSVTGKNGINIASSRSGVGKTRRPMVRRCRPLQW